MKLPRLDDRVKTKHDFISVNFDGATYIGGWSYYYFTQTHFSLSRLLSRSLSQKRERQCSRLWSSLALSFSREKSR
jgi:hypothetical protein